MGLFTTYKGLESEQNVKYKNLPFSNDPSFNSQPFIQVSPSGDDNKFTITGNSSGILGDLNKAATSNDPLTATFAKSILSPTAIISSLSSIPKKFSVLSSIATGTYRTTMDVIRLTKFMSTPSGLEFIAKQELLSLMAVRTETSTTLNGGVYNPLTTLAQAGSSFAGGHILPISDTLQRYGPLAYNNGKLDPEIYTDNRQVELHNKHILKKTENSNTLYSYVGGPGSVFGIGATSIKFATQPDGVTPIRTMGVNFEFPEGEFNTPATYMAMYKHDLKTKYEQENIKIESIETRYGLGNPGRREYDSNIGKYIQRSSITNLDTVNGQVIYSSTVTGNVKEKIDVATNDLVTFKIGILDVGGIKTNYMHFRSFIDSFSDSYSSDWSSQTYMGRGEKLYKYNSFDRSISVSFTVAAQSRGEMAGMYQKLNYLASTVTPQYTDNGYMTGNIAKLTVGNYVKDQHGKIDSISYEIPEDSPWLVSTVQYQKQQAHDLRTVINELPFIIKVQMRFTPIHDFRPELATNVLNGRFGDQRYITQIYESEDNSQIATNVSTQFGGDQPEVSVVGKITPNTPPPQGKLRPLFTSLKSETKPDPTINPNVVGVYKNPPPTPPPGIGTYAPPKITGKTVTKDLLRIPSPSNGIPDNKIKSLKNRNLFKQLKGVFKNSKNASVGSI